MGEHLRDQVNAHIVVGGRVEAMVGRGTRITPAVYVRPDTVPDAPELAEWIEVTEPITTLYDVTGAHYGPAERAQLAHDLGAIVSDVMRFATATNQLRAGKLADAEATLEQLRSQGSRALPDRYLALFEADAILPKGRRRSLAPTASVPSRSRVAARCERPTASGIRPGRGPPPTAPSLPGCEQPPPEALDAVRTEFARLESADVPLLVRLKARLGALKVRSCATRSKEASPPRPRRSPASGVRRAVWRTTSARSRVRRPSLRHRSQPTPSRSGLSSCLPSPMAKTSTRLPTSLHRALDLEARPERAGVWALELALLEAHACHGDAARRALRDATATLDIAADAGRLSDQQVRTQTKEVGNDVERILASCPS